MKGPEGSGPGHGSAGAVRARPRRVVLRLGNGSYMWGAGCHESASPLPRTMYDPVPMPSTQDFTNFAAPTSDEGTSRDDAQLSRFRAGPW